ncbi:growth/differentiatio [Gouania willdenowi]|uniref:TGF-beta family profile domain-containing protein n=1 Tax=Gouania willdenowi TaxID=441366 RepID=A0A8C5HBI9_GOUWI|nr:growth/differentiation factor 9 [Gouania willdenowi]
MMEKLTPGSALLHTTVLLLLLTCDPPLFSPSLSACGSLVPPLGDFTHPYDSVFFPLLRALTEHGGTRWDLDIRKKMKPDQQYIKYLTEVYRKSSRVQRSLDSSDTYNTVRLIRPQDRCLGKSNKESFMQDLSYRLDQVKRKEHLLKSALLYSFDPSHSAPITSVCHISIKEQGRSNQCQLCPGVHHVVNFTASAEGRTRRNWVEVDITWLLQPLLNLQRKSLHLFVNISCPENQRVTNDGHKSLLEFRLRSPALLLYLNDNSKTSQSSAFDTKAGQRSSAAFNQFQRQLAYQSDHKPGRKGRWRRDSSKSKWSDKSLDIQLPELLPSSEYPTNDCALYDFRVRFSQLKLDHWIVFPPKYNPRYCRGICPRTLGFIYGSPVHTMVQNLIYENLDSSVPRPSCVPSHYSPLSVLIFDEDGSYVYKEIKDMIATRCTCR